MLSIGVFFSLMVAGLASRLPHPMFVGLTAPGVQTASAATISHLPPIDVLFARLPRLLPEIHTARSSADAPGPNSRRVLSGQVMLPEPDLRPLPILAASSSPRAGDAGLRLVTAMASALSRPSSQPGRGELLGGGLCGGVAGEGGRDASEPVVDDDAVDGARDGVVAGASRAAGRPGVFVMV